MFEETIDILLDFAKRNDLQLNYSIDEVLDVCRFRFENEDKTWRFERAVPLCTLDSFYYGPKGWLARSIINDLIRSSLKGEDNI